MLSHSRLNKALWGETLSYARHIVNWLPSTTLNRRTPFEVWSSSPANDYDYMCVFGCLTYYHVTESKLDPWAGKAIFLGFNGGVNGYRLWCYESIKVILSRDVTFDEFSMLQQERSQEKRETTKWHLEFETSTFSIKTIQTIHVEEDSDESSNEEDVITPTTI